MPSKRKEKTAAVVPAPRPVAQRPVSPPEPGLLDWFAEVHRANAALAAALGQAALEIRLDLPWSIWREVRIVAIAAVQMTGVVWAVRFVSQLLDASWMNESILAGHYNKEIRDVEIDLDYRDRMKGGI